MIGNENCNILFLKGKTKRGLCLVELGLSRGELSLFPFMGYGVVVMCKVEIRIRDLREGFRNFTT